MRNIKTKCKVNGTEEVGTTGFHFALGKQLADFMNSCIAGRLCRLCGPCCNYLQGGASWEVSLRGWGLRSIPKNGQDLLKLPTKEEIKLMILGWFEQERERGTGWDCSGIMKSQR